jgi:hypothetical protein
LCDLVHHPDHHACADNDVDQSSKGRDTDRKERAPDQPIDTTVKGKIMNDLFNLLKGIAPTLATAVAGPLGGAAVSAIASRLGVGDSVEAVAKAIAGDPQAAQKLAEMELEYYKIEQNNLTDRLKADMASDSWLSKNIRPMVLIFLLVAYTGFAIASMFDLETRNNYVELLGNWGMVVMSFYFGGRTFEKIADKVKK